MTLPLKPESTPFSTKTDNQYDFLAKVVLVGPPLSGKSAVLEKTIDNKFRCVYEYSFVEFGSFLLPVDDQLGKLEIWDLGGLDKLAKIRKSYYCNCAAVIFFCPINAPNKTTTFEWLSTEIETARQTCKVTQVAFYLVPTKGDKELSRSISDEEMITFAQEQGLTLLSNTSAKEDSQEVLIEKIWSPVLKQKKKISDAALTSSMVLSEHDVLKMKIKALREKIEQIKDIPEELQEYYIALTKIFQEGGELYTAVDKPISVKMSRIQSFDEAVNAFQTVLSAFRAIKPQRAEKDRAAHKAFQSIDTSAATVSFYDQATEEQKKAFSNSLNRLLTASKACDTPKQKWSRIAIEVIVAAIGAVGGAIIGALVSLLVVGHDGGASAVIGAVKGGLIATSVFTSCCVYGGILIGSGIFYKIAEKLFSWFLKNNAKTEKVSSHIPDKTDVKKKSTGSQFFGALHLKAQKLRIDCAKEKLIPGRGLIP